MNILVTGSTGLVGSALLPFLTAGGNRVARLVRSRTRPAKSDIPEIQWDPAVGSMDLSGLDEFDAVVHLAGESIAEGKWTPAKKASIRDSRVKGTTLLCQSLAQLQQPPKVLVCASAIGYYGDRGDEILDEGSSPGKGFLSEVCKDWEAAAQPAVKKGIRVVQHRLGMILSPSGGALAKMLPPFRMGVGGIIGSGKQYMSWIALDDVLGTIHHALLSDGLAGPVNTTSPHPVTNREFTKTLGRVLGRPTVFPMPEFAARLAFGEMADELLLASTRVEPARLLGSRYSFRFPQLEEALRHLLGKNYITKSPP